MNNNLIEDNGMYLYKDNSFNTINVTMTFVADPNSRESAIYDLLCSYMLKANKKYSTKQIDVKTRELYDLDFDIQSSTHGSKRLFFCSFDLISPSVVGDNYSKKVFEFMKEILLNPDFEKQEILDDVKKIMLSQYSADFTDPDKLAEAAYYKYMLTNPITEYDCTTDINYVKQLFDSITLEDLKDLYNKTVTEDKFYRGLVFGNITDEEYKKFREIFPFKTNQENLDYSSKYGSTKDILIIPDESISESTVYITYSMDNMDEGTKEILSDILNGSSTLCLNILREKYKLVYESEVEFTTFDNYLIIKSKIDKKNFNKLVNACDELIEYIQDEIKLKPLFERSKESIKNLTYLISENKEMMISMLCNYILNIHKGMDIDKLIEKLDSIKEEDITSKTKSLKRESVFIYRGDAK